MPLLIVFNEIFQRLKKDATQQAELATTGVFLDSNANPLKVLGEMKIVRLLLEYLFTVFQINFYVL